jgi:hypothetical protein
MVTWVLGSGYCQLDEILEEVAISLNRSFCQV